MLASPYEDYSWGPPIWQLLHVLAAHVDEQQYDALGNDLVGHIVRICKHLPCPQCSMDSFEHVRLWTPQDVDTKQKLIDLLFAFHNSVNAKKGKPIFGHSDMITYRERNLMQALREFQAVYFTPGANTSLHSHMRNIICKDLFQWVQQHLAAFC